MSLNRITLQLARGPGLPAGDPSQGYFFVAPLGPDDLIDVDEWRRNRKACTVRRFHPDPGESADGWLTHRGRNWVFHYDEDDEGDDEAGFRLAEHPLREGEYITVASHGDTPLTYKVTDVSRV